MKNISKNFMLKKSEQILIAYIVLTIISIICVPRMLFFNTLNGLIVIIFYLVINFIVRKSKVVQNKFTKIGLMWLVVLLFLTMTVSVKDFSYCLIHHRLTDFHYTFLIKLIPINFLIVYSCIDLGYDFEALGLKFKKNIKWSTLIFELFITTGLCFVLITLRPIAFQYDKSLILPFIISLFVTILGSVFVEEVLYRGMLFTFLLNLFSEMKSEKLKYILITILNAGIFVFSHTFNPLSDLNWTMLAIIVVIFGCISRIRTGSIYFVVLLHAIYNTLIGW